MYMNLGKIFVPSFFRFGCR